MKKEKLVLEPTIIEADDYHEFDKIKEILSIFFKNITFKELVSDTGIYKAEFYSRLK